MAWATGSTVVQLPGMGRTGVWSQVGERVVRHQDFDDGCVTCEMPLVSRWGCPGGRQMYESGVEERGQVGGITFEGISPRMF